MRRDARGSLTGRRAGLTRRAGRFYHPSGKYEQILPHCPSADAPRRPMKRLCSVCLCSGRRGDSPPLKPPFRRSAVPPTSGPSESTRSTPVLAAFDELDRRHSQLLDQLATLSERVEQVLEAESCSGQQS